jgi:hypothetical protein
MSLQLITILKIRKKKHALRVLRDVARILGWLAVLLPKLPYFRPKVIPIISDIIINLTALGAKMQF